MLTRRKLAEALADGQHWYESTGKHYDVIRSGKGFKAVQRSYAHKHGKPVLATTFVPVYRAPATLSQDEVESMSIIALAAKYGVSRATMNRRVRAMGVQPSKRKNTVSRAELTEAMTRMTVQDFCKQKGLQTQLVHRLCREWEIARPHKIPSARGRKVDPVHLQEHLKHMTISAYARCFGFPYSTVYKAAYSEKESNG